MEEALDEAKDKGINEDDIKNILLVGDLQEFLLYRNL